MTNFTRNFPHFTPFFKEMKRYRFSHFRRDLFAGLSVALLVIPQGIAYAFLAELPIPSGIFSAVLATLIASFFCGSRHVISGPSTSIVLLLHASMAEVMGTYYPHLPAQEKSALVLVLLMQLTALIGVFQLLFSFFSFSKMLQFISKPVIFGYFAGVAIALITTQLFTLIGMQEGMLDLTVLGKWHYFFSHLPKTQVKELLVGGISLGVLFILRKTKLPTLLIMLVFVSVVGVAMEKFTSYPIHTLKENLHFSFPQFSLPLFSLEQLNKLVLPAFAISLFGILEVFSVSRVVQAKSGDFASSSQDIFGVGMANCLVSLLQGGIPGSFSIARTMLNYTSGAKTRFAGVFSSFFTLTLFYFAFSLFSYVPKASIAALLIFSAFYVLDYKQLKVCLKATKEDAFVFILTLLSCLFFTLDNAFLVGILVSIITYLRKAAEPKYVEYAFNNAGRLNLLPQGEKFPRKVRILGIGGELFFGTVDSLEDILRRAAKNIHTQVIILRMNGVHHMDASLCLSLLRVHEYLQKKEKRLMLSGLNPEVWKVLATSSLLKQMGEENFFLADEGRPQLSTWKACLRAQELIDKKL